MDPVLLIGIAMLAGAPLVLSPMATLLGAAGVAVAARGRVHPAWTVVALVAMGVSAIRARAELSSGDAAYRATLEALEHPTRCEGRGVVVASPVVQSGPGAERGRRGRIDVRLEGADCGGRKPVSLTARLHGASEDLTRGDRVVVTADLAAVHLFANEGRRDPRVVLARSGVTASGGVVDLVVERRSRSLASLIDRARAHVRGRIEATFHPEAAPLARALVIGETDLDPSDEEAFRASGLAHLLAVSGTHLVIAVLGACAALRTGLLHVTWLAARADVGRISAAVGIPAAWLYASLAGAGGSAIRAASMLAVALLARALGRRPNAVRAFAWSLALGAAADPLMACDASFALSAGATAGLLALEPALSALLSRGPAPVRTVARGLAATLAAVAGCAPVLATMSPSLPVLGVLANLVAAPIGEAAALPVCLAHALLAWAPAAERGAAIVGSGALLVVRAIARWTAAQPGAVIAMPSPTDAELCVLAVGAALIARAPAGSRRIVLAVVGAALLVCEAAAVRAGRPPDRLRVTVLDVGQGDATLVDLPDGSAMLVDGGGLVGSPADVGQRVIAPVLRARRRSHLDVVVLSHPHPDHFGGLASILERTSVGELWDTGQGEAEGAGPTYAALLETAKQKGVRIVRPSELCGAPRAFGAANVEVLAPCPSFDPDLGANDNSLVVRIAFGARAALLVGDAEHEEEKRLLATAHPKLRADFLKVGHHGSRTSTTPSFVEAVDPWAVAISCGVRNRFGHPHPETLETLASRPLAVLRTDRGGAVVWETDGERAHAFQPWR